MSGSFGAHISSSAVVGQRGDGGGGGEGGSDDNNNDSLNGSSKLAMNDPSGQVSVSIFQLVAQESLTTGLRKAFKFIAQTLINYDPAKFRLLYTRFDEIYLVLDCIIQYSHLRAFNASFAEHFYTLKRVQRPISGLIQPPPGSQVAQNRLSWSIVIRSLVILTVFPYLREKFDRHYRRLKIAAAEGTINRERHVIEFRFLQIYPLFIATLSSLELAHQVAYAVGKSESHSIYLTLAGVLLRHQTIHDLRAREISTEILLGESGQPLSWPLYMARLSWLSWKWVATKVGLAMSSGAFFIQFLDYWYASHSSAPGFAPTPIPPPPESYPVQFRKGRCPLCNRPRRNDTALDSTGFVFCYTCIRAHLDHDKSCPITGFPSTTEHLVKLYPPTS